MSGILAEIETVYRGLGVCVVAHIHNPASGTQTRDGIGRNFDRIHQAKRPEHRIKIGDGGCAGNIPDM
jgi:hypothetical protein